MAFFKNFFSEPPPTYDSLFGQHYEEAREQSSNQLEFLQKYIESILTTSKIHLISKEISRMIPLAQLNSYMFSILEVPTNNNNFSFPVLSKNYSKIFFHM